MSRQNKSKRVKATRVQVTTVHTKAVATTGQKRTRQPFEGRAIISFTKKLTSMVKGTCKIIKDKNGLRRVSASQPTRNISAE